MGGNYLFHSLSTMFLDGWSGKVYPDKCTNNYKKAKDKMTLLDQIFKVVVSVLVSDM